MANLVFSRGQTPFFRVLLQSSSTKIGRSEACDLVLSDPGISREQAAIYFHEGHYLIKKLSQNSLKVNGKEVEIQALKEGDQISLGPWMAGFFEGKVESSSREETSMTPSQDYKTQAIAGGSGGLMMQEFQLMIQEPSKPPRSYPFLAETVLVGAHEKNDVVFNDPYVSSRHLKLMRKEGRVFLYDLGSTNGTYINGVRVREAELEAGFTIKVGQCKITLECLEKLQPASPLQVEEFCSLVGSSPIMQNLYGLLQRIGPSEATVLILGESGTGKELVARAIHDLSPRAKKPFVAINCGAISATLIESELFGHEKGAFTGAERKHNGAFGQAHGGTLFLDEIGELPLDLQPKLLRVLENKTYRRVGGSEELQADVRIVAATHQDLAQIVREKKFREDLFFRLFVLPVFLPPLRERPEDLPLLCGHFLKEFATGAKAKTLSASALHRFEAHPFPGNIRELKNVLLRSVLLAKGEKIEEQDLLFLEDLKPDAPLLTTSGATIEKLEEMERRLVLRALAAHQWNKAKVAEVLGVAKSTLFAKIKLYNLEEPEKAE